MALRRQRRRGEHVYLLMDVSTYCTWGIYMLQQARTVGDCLVVALNDDASVRLLKGDRRPLISH